MTLRDDAILLSGYIYGTSNSLPTAIRDAIKRVTAQADEEDRGLKIEQQLDTEFEIKLPDGASPPAEHKSQEPDPSANHAEPAVGQPSAPADEAATEPTGKKFRKKPDLTPEQRAAVGARLKAARASKRGEQSASPTQAEEPAAIAPKPYSPVPVEKLLSDHREYVGKREPGQQLTDQDWPDIKNRLAKNPDRKALAADYNVDLEDLNYFISSCQRREQRSGEALASPSNRASDATQRPRW